MFFRMIYDNTLAQAAYLIGCQRTGEAILIDPERDIDRYLNIAAEQKMKIVAVAETHIHADYLSGVREVAEKTGAKVFVSDEGDADWKYEWVINGKYNHQLLHDGDTFRVGHIEFQTVHTPGHTPEHICFLVTDRGGGASEPMGIITGDFVFVGDLGRPDLLETAAGVAGVKESSARTLFDSSQRFRQLPEYLQVWPAHGAGSACGKALGAVPQSTVGYEKRFNPVLQLTDRESFVQNILEGQPEPPLYFARMKRDNKLGPAVLGALPQPKELNAKDLQRLDAKSQAIVDTRAWPQFRAGHIRGALFAPANSQLPTVAGSFIDEGEEIYLICDSHQVDFAVRCLIRIGLDNIRGYATPATLEQAAAEGLTLVATREIDAAAFKKEMRQPNAAVLDVRRGSEYECGHVPGAANIAHTRLRAHLDQVPEGTPLLVHCQGGVRSAYATSLLERHGFTPTNLAGGFGAYEKSGGEVVREAVTA